MGRGMIDVDEVLETGTCRRCESVFVLKFGQERA